MFLRPRNIPALVLPILALSGAAWGNEPTERLIKILSEGSKDEPADTKAVAQALTDGAKADALVPLWFAPKRQATPLAMAAVNGDVEAVRLLLPGAQLNQAASGSLPAMAADATRYTPLMVAVCPAVVWFDRVRPELKRRMELVPVDKGSPAVVRELLAAGADPAARDSRGRTALALAVESCQPVMLRYLLDLGLRDLGAAGPVEPEILMEHPDSSANTTMGFLHRIVCLEELKALLREAGLGPAESKGESMAAPMGLETMGQPAPGAGKRENRSLDWALARTVQEACVVANSSFSPAVEERLSEAHLQEAKRLLAAGADVNAPTSKGFTTLMTLASQKKIPAALAALLLVQEGLEVDRTDVNQNTALFYAAERGHTDLVECLLLAGADPLRVDRDGKDALMKAVRFDHPGVVELLLERGGDLTRADKAGKTSLHRVAKGKEVEKLLQARKASAAAGAGQQATAALAAVARMETKGDSKNQSVSRIPGGDAEKATFAGPATMGVQARTSSMGAGVAQDGPLSSGDLAFKMAFLSALATDRAEDCQRHLEAGVDVNMPMGRGWTPLMMVADSERLPWHLTGLLLGQVKPGHGQVKLELDLANADGRTALMIAARRGHANLVELLLELGAKPDLKDAEGNTALNMADEHPRVRLLLQAAAHKID